MTTPVRLLITLVVLYAGQVAASFVFCTWTHTMTLFTFPYWQWIQVAWNVDALFFWPRTETGERLTWAYYWHHPSEDTFSLLFRHPLVAFAISSFFVLIMVVQVARYWWRVRQPSLYGDSQWANKGHLAAHSIETHRNPFA